MLAYVCTGVEEYVHLLHQFKEWAFRSHIQRCVCVCICVPLSYCLERERERERERRDERDRKRQVNHRCYSKDSISTTKREILYQESNGDGERGRKGGRQRSGWSEGECWHLCIYTCEGGEVLPEAACIEHVYSMWQVQTIGHV